MSLNKEYNKIPPLKLIQTLEELKNLIPENIYKKTTEVIEIKSKGLEKDVILRIPEFDEFFNLELEKEYAKFNKRSPKAEVFNEFLQKTLNL